VIPHGHFGNLTTPVDRVAVEADLGLRHGVLRLGVVGAPRPEKRADLAMAAVAASSRDDIELLVTTAGPVPDDPRIVALPPERVSREEYNRRLAVIDVLVMPFDDGEMLTTGTVGDAVGLGLPSLVSDWQYLAEALGEAGIPYGSDLTRAIDTLGEERLDLARAAAVKLQAAYDWNRLAELHADLLEQVGTAKLLEAVPRLCLRSNGGEQVDQSSVGVAQDHRAVAPRHVGWLQYDEVLDPFPDRVDVIDAQFDKDRVILAG
jgi:glycosyltransferase involved in cell wall biosynthesis